MTEITRQIETARGSLVLALALANGVGRRGRRVALRVLRSAYIDPGRAPLQSAPTPIPVLPAGPLFHPRISGPPLPTTNDQIASNRRAR